MKQQITEMTFENQSDEKLIRMYERLYQDLFRLQKNSEEWNEAMADLDELDKILLNRGYKELFIEVPEDCKIIKI